MSALQVKNVPEDLHEALRTRAAAEGRTVGDYVLDVLRRDLALPTQRAWLTEMLSGEPVDGVDGGGTLDAVRRERDEGLGAGRRR